MEAEYVVRKEIEKAPKTIVVGQQGSGKDSVAQELCSKLQKENPSYELVSMGNIRREAARKRNMSIEDFNLWSEKNPDEGDKTFDNQLMEYAKQKEHLLVVSRMAWHLIPKNIKIYLDVEPYEGARRIFYHKKTENQRNEYHTKDVLEQLVHNELRIKGDITRYSSLYGVNPYVTYHYDLSIDTTHKNIATVTTEILKYIYCKRNDNALTAVLTSENTKTL